MDKSEKEIVTIVGAGPAGLTAGYELSQRGEKSVIFEKDNIVGGISRTVPYKGYHFDIGGHRFFTKVDRVMEMWQKILGNDFLKRPRMSHIYYKEKFFSYPIKPFDVVRKLGVWESFLAGLSYLKAKIFKRRKEESFEDYIVNNFGWRLYNTFFKSYTEKVWGIPCTEIKAEWAAQRIKGLSLTTLLKTMIFGNRGNKIKTLIEEFYYPRLGPGMMWRKTKDEIDRTGLGKVLFNTKPVSIKHQNGKIVSVTARNDKNEIKIFNTKALISSMPIAELFNLFTPAIDKKYLEACNSLNYRDFLTVALILKRKETFLDNWIYIHDPRVQVGRIQNYKNWSPEMVPDQDTTCLGLEYFCFKTDDIWKMKDEDLIKMATKELETIGLIKADEVVDGSVVRMEKTYPVYDDAYEKAMPLVKEAFSKFSNIYPVGRNGMHKYNNQDHAMFTAMLAVENILDGTGHNLWQVNVDRTYHEEKEV
jgi:protoporphyrinogen oxidase